MVLLLCFTYCGLSLEHWQYLNRYAHSYNTPNHNDALLHTPTHWLHTPTLLHTPLLTHSLLVQAGVLISRSWTLRDGLILSSITGTTHLLSILYLRFAYHKVYEGKFECLQINDFLLLLQLSLKPYDITLQPLVLMSCDLNDDCLLLWNYEIMELWKWPKDEWQPLPLLLLRWRDIKLTPFAPPSLQHFVLLSPSPCLLILVFCKHYRELRSQIVLAVVLSRSHWLHLN